MLNNLDNYIFTNILSVINSIILMFGIYRVGLVSQKLILKNFFILKKNNDIYFYAFLIGAYLISYLLYILTIANLANNFIYIIISRLIFLIGVFSLLEFIYSKNLNIKFKKLHHNNYLSSLIIICFIGLLLISLSPITHADSLAYHLPFSINIFNTGKFNTELLPMEFKYGSLGEMMIILGLGVKAEQFGVLIQLSSLFALIPLFLNKKKFLNHLLFLIILTTPITIFFISSPKPQLLQCVSTILIFSFLINGLKNFEKKNFYLILGIIFFILSINVLVKFSFIISGLILYLYCIFLAYKERLVGQAIIISIIVFSITILPSWIHRYYYYETPIFNLFLSPLPVNIYGYDNFHNFLTSGKIDIFTFINLIIPKSMGKIFTIYGPILFIIFFVKSKSFLKYKNFFIMTLIFWILHFVAGSGLTRFFYEGFLWTIYLVSISDLRVNKYFNGYKVLINAQIIIVTISIYFAAISLFPGSINNELRDKIMTKYAYGYSLAKWVNANTDKSSTILTTHRSISFYSSRTYPTLFLWFVKFDNRKSILYANYLKDKKINKIVFFGSELKYGPFKNCLGKQHAYKKNVGYWVGRNPYNRGGQAYNGWIFDFEHEKLPGCLVR